jgi:uncharacterized damage-inducible protein DinB
MGRMADGFIDELTREAETTRNQLARVPEERFDWRPHDKSLTLGELALHIATTPGGVADLITNLEVPAAPFLYVQPESLAEVLSALEESVANARAKLDGWDDAAMMAEWKMTSNGETLMAVPRAGMIRSIMLNHWYHHRGQLQVYLRMVGASVPSVYGPTADENPFE